MKAGFQFFKIESRKEMTTMSLTGYSADEAFWILLGLAAGLFLLLSAQILILLKIENEYIRFITGKSDRGKWAHKRAAVKEWNDHVHTFCDENNILIVVNKPLKYPTTLSDLLDNY